MPATICVIAFFACLAFILILVILVRNNKTDGPVPKTFKEAFKAFREAQNWSERAFVVFVCTPLFLGEGYKIFVLILGVLAFLCLIAICAPTPSTVFEYIQRILHEVYKFFAK